MLEICFRGRLHCRKFCVNPLVNCIRFLSNTRKLTFLAFLEVPITFISFHSRFEIFSNSFNKMLAICLRGGGLRRFFVNPLASCIRFLSNTRRLTSLAYLEVPITFITFHLRFEIFSNSFNKMLAICLRGRDFIVEISVSTHWPGASDFFQITSG